MNLTKPFYGALVASAVALSAPVASAAVIDFTTGSPLSGTIGGGITYTVTASGGPLNTTTPFDGTSTPSSSLGLDFKTDGYGVADDEISYKPKANVVESITITFSTLVKVVSFAFLDLFKDNTKGFGESAILTAADGTTYELEYDPSSALTGGYAEATGLGIITDKITFTVGLNNDAIGNADGALAGVEVAPIPVPAAGLLLLGGLGGLAALRRRKTA